MGLKRGGLSGAVMVGLGGLLTYRGVSGHCSCYSALGINTADDSPPAPQEYFERGVHVEESVTISRPARELYDYWKNLENLPNFMDHLNAVRVIDDRKSHWTAKAPAGMKVEWDAEIINDEPGSLIAWRSTGGGSIDNAGSVRFVEGPAGRGTEVKVVLDYIPPAGKLGAWIAKLFGEEPSTQVREDLRHFKQVMEAGERPTTEGQPRGS
jgi:uncharacterized membrane protein